MRSEFCLELQQTGTAHFSIVQWIHICQTLTDDRSHQRRPAMPGLKEFVLSSETSRFTPCLWSNASGTWTLKRTHSAMPDNTQQCECYYKKVKDLQAVLEQHKHCITTFSDNQCEHLKLYRKDFSTNFNFITFTCFNREI